MFYPGAGHSRDNIVAYLPGSKVLFGGCFIKAADARNLGNVRDGDAGAWPGSLKALRERFPNAEIVIPGHGEVGGPELIEHTMNLLKRSAAVGFN